MTYQITKEIRVHHEDRWFYQSKVLTLKEQAMEAFEHILSESTTQKGMETVLKALQSLPDDLYVDDAVSSN